MNAALKAMSTWRNELVETNEKNGKQVIEKMASAAAALGWPEQIFDAARTQTQTIAKTQIKMMDQMMDAWDEQLKLPDPMTASPSAMLSKLKSLPGLAPTGSSPPAEALLSPLQIWIQSAEQWQKFWAQAMTPWSDYRKLF
jgi:polyhydroxyalkanoate synthesis regulator protein